MFGLQMRPIREEIPLNLASDALMPETYCMDDSIPPTRSRDDSIPPSPRVSDEVIPPTRCNMLDTQPTYHFTLKKSNLSTSSRIPSGKSASGT